MLITLGLQVYNYDLLWVLKSVNSTRDSSFCWDSCPFCVGHFFGKTYFGLFGAPGLRSLGDTNLRGLRVGPEKARSTDSQQLGTYRGRP